ncbi:uncharacterized protein LOC127625002 isoform X2 [Xyrauchen texanus]|uniref:uncharacterized protein LOC127625002 isoform X2 n=1 Tax=Xyrauchen texanus TaxID=154827 RepID=UPI002241F845|nr:uncharacterized protein LOC127625002 isoform X2 [Xyrauchen texanus]
MFIMSAQVDVIHADEQQMLQTPVKIEVKQEEIKEENTTEEHQSGEVVPADYYIVLNATITTNNCVRDLHRSQTLAIQMFIMSAQVDVIHADEQQMLQTPVKIEVKQEEIKEENTTEEHQSGEVVPAELMEVKEECEELNEVKDEKKDFISGEKCLNVSNTKKNLSPRRPRRSAAKKSFTCSRCGMCFSSKSSLKKHEVSTSDSITSQHVCLDSDEEFTISSDEEWHANDELFHFEEGLDPAEDTIADDDENDSDQTPVAKRAKKAKTRKKQSTLSWKTETDIDTVPQTLKFLPAREPGPQLSPADAHTP